MIKAINRYAAAWVVALGISLLLVAFPAKAQTTPSLPATVKIETNNVTPNFPDTIDFRFSAQTEPGAPVFNSLELAYRVEGEVETNIRHSDLAPGDPLTADISIDTQKNYLPPGTRVSYYWLLGVAGGDTYQTPTQEFTYQDTRYPFKELKNGLFTVRWFQGDAAFGQAAMGRVTGTVDKLSRLYKVRPDTPINLTIYPDTATMFTALPPNTQEWVGGQAIPELGTIVLAIAPGDTAEIGRSIPHEVSHQVVYQATRNPYNNTPKWLDEGLAVNNQDQVDGFLIQAFEKARDERTLFPLRVLNGAFPADSQLSYVAYGESVEVVQYILQKYGNAGIEKILGSFKQGVSYDEAVQIGLGISLDQLDREWKQSLGYPVPELSPATPTPTALAAIPTPSGSGPGPSPTLAVAPTATPAGTAPAPSTSAARPTPAQPLVPEVTPAVTRAVVPVVTPDAGTTTTTPGTPSAIRGNTTVSASQTGANGSANGGGSENGWLVAGLAGTAVILLGGLALLLVVAFRKQS